MRKRSIISLAVPAAVAACVAAGVADAAGGPPPPTSTNGNAVETVAQGGGLATPTSFAFGDGQVFEGDGGSTQGNGPPNGGVFLLANGTGTKLAGSPKFVSGLAFEGGTLYVAGGTPTSRSSATFQIQAWSGWNGSAFTTQKAIFTAPKKFQGFNGLGFGANGRLYVGVDVGLLNNNDYGPKSLSPYLYDILSMTSTGKQVKVFATGMRQPWQMAFPAGSSSPFVSDLGQDKGVKNPPDFVLRVKAGQNYGFPKCSQTAAAACAGYAKPFRKFSPHTDVMGLGIAGGRLYMSEFLGNKGKTGLVASMPLSGKGKVKTLLTGFVAPVVGLAVHDGYVYVGALSGQVFRVKL